MKVLRETSGEFEIDIFEKILMNFIRTAREFRENFEETVHKFWRNLGMTGEILKKL